MHSGPNPTFTTNDTRHLAVLPWTEVTLNTETNFDETEDDTKKNRKISVLSFVMIEEEIAGVHSIKDKEEKGESEEKEDADIFTKSLDPSAFNLALRVPNPEKQEIKPFQGLSLRS